MDAILPRSNDGRNSVLGASPADLQRRSGRDLLACFWIGYPKWKEILTINQLLLVFLLAVLANVAYCATYVPDVFAQLSGFREPWRKYRWVVLVIGLLFSGVITRFWALAMFSAYNS